jgi:TolA-binding protein
MRFAIRCAAAAFALLLASPAVPPIGVPVARAQMDSREAIALQNQILQLRQEIEQLRRGGSSLGAVQQRPPPGRGGALPAGQAEVLQQLLQRVGQIEEEVRQLRGRAEEAEFRNRQLAADLQKLQGDVDFRLQQLEGGGGRPTAPAPQRPAASTPPPAPIPAPPTQAAGSAPRPPERALSEGQAALQRRDWAAAETAAREVLANRGGGTRAQDAQILLGDALTGKGDYQTAALAYDDAYRRNRQSARAPEAMIGLARAFTGFGARREACATLDDLRSEFPRLNPTLAERAADARRRAGCR